MQEVNVRVAVRVRPLMPKERLANESVCVRIIPSSNQLVIGKDRAFTFDYVLSSKTQQEECYVTCVDSLVRSCFEGYNATIFAYGQTGSGKTFTVGGGNMAAQVDDDFGIIPRAVKQIFETIQATPGRHFCVKISYVEIYREELQDLLDLETNSRDLHLREDDKGNTLITGLSEIECKSVQEVMSSLQQGATYRHTGSTMMNEQSSRSHAVFTIFIEQTWQDGKDAIENSGCERIKSDDSEIIDDGELQHYVCAKFHFVDLAGSERVHKTGNVGERFKESVYINSGLLALGNVISALGDVKRRVLHIPYRDSKITRLLKDSLGGNAQTLMICCISPAAAHFDESLNALKYANRARNIRNKPIVNRDPHSIRFEEMQCEIKALREELQRQQTSLVLRASEVTFSNPGTAGSPQDALEIQRLEQKVIALQTECAHYKTIVDDAVKQLVDIRSRDALTCSQNGRLDDWLELMEEVENKVPATLNREVWENQTIQRLEGELEQCKNDLKSDVEIFADKSREMSQVQEQVDELESVNRDIAEQLVTVRYQLRQQADQLVERQLFIERLQGKLQEAEQVAPPDDDLDEVMCEGQMSGDGPMATTMMRKRATSVPARVLQISGTDLGTGLAAGDARTRAIHTSPAVFSLARVMQGFRARSQLLVSRLEDDDNVRQRGFSDEDHKDEEEEEEEDERTRFQRDGFGRGTYKVPRPRVRSQLPLAADDGVKRSQTDDEKLTIRNNGEKGGKMVPGSMGKDVPPIKIDVSRLKSSTELRKKRLIQTELDVRQSTQKVHDLAINIRMKEQLIRELVKTSRDAQTMNKQYEEKIKELEKEKTSVKSELNGLQVALQELEVKEQKDKFDKGRLQGEFRKKMELAKTRYHALQKRQKDTERMANITGQNGRRILDLETAVEKMKKQHDQMQRRLKEEVDRKARLQRDMQKEQQRIRELETRNAQQQKVLRIKTEEMGALQRRLRASNGTITANNEQMRLEDQRKWIEKEIEKALDQRRKVEALETDLEKREDILAKKEAIIAEHSKLEIKKLRSSQVISKDRESVSSRLESVERQLQERSHDGSVACPGGDLEKLQQGRDDLRRQRGALDAKLHDGAILSAAEERRLIVLQEAVEAIDAAIDYKNDSILHRQEELQNSGTQGEESLIQRLNSLSMMETRSLLSRFFDKVIELRESERRRDLECSEMEMKISEQERIVAELESSLRHVAMETDRRLTQQQQHHEQRVQLLMQQLAEAPPSGDGEQHPPKMQQLEKDLYYYRKTCRELKRRLREAIGGTSIDPDKENGDIFKKPSTPKHLQSKTAVTHDGDGVTSPRTAHVTRDGDDAMSPRTARSVRISRKDLRRMSDEEVSTRRSAVGNSTTATLPTDSLDVSGKNPWA